MNSSWFAVSVPHQNPYIGRNSSFCISLERTDNSGVHEYYQARKEAIGGFFESFAARKNGLPPKFIDHINALILQHL